MQNDTRYWKGYINKSIHTNYLAIAIAIAKGSASHGSLDLAHVAKGGLPFQAASSHGHEVHASAGERGNTWPVHHKKGSIAIQPKKG